MYNLMHKNKTNDYVPSYRTFQVPLKFRVEAALLLTPSPSPPKEPASPCIDVHSSLSFPYGLPTDESVLKLCITLVQHFFNFTETDLHCILLSCLSTRHYACEIHPCWNTQLWGTLTTVYYKCTPNFFIQYTVDWHTGCFQGFAVTNRAAFSHTCDSFSKAVLLNLFHNPTDTEHDTRMANSSY